MYKIYVPVDDELLTPEAIKAAAKQRMIEKSFWEKYEVKHSDNPVEHMALLYEEKHEVHNLTSNLDVVNLTSRNFCSIF